MSRLRPLQHSGWPDHREAWYPSEELSAGLSMMNHMRSVLDQAFLATLT